MCVEKKSTKLQGIFSGILEVSLYSDPVVEIICRTSPDLLICTQFHWANSSQILGRMLNCTAFPGLPKFRLLTKCLIVTPRPQQATLWKV